MSQSSAPMMPAPSPMKKKVITALAAVVIGHMGVLWAVGHMKTPELKPIEKDPIQVRFVKLEEAPKPLPPKPKPPEPKKEPPKPKEVKIVDKPLPPPPKKVEKVQQVKKADAPKPVEKPAEAAKPSPVVSATISETKRPAPEPAPVVKSEPPAQPAPTAPPAPKSVQLGGGVSWLKAPSVRFSPGELKSSCSMVVAISANENGKVIAVNAKNSSCGAAVDRKVTAAVKRGQLTKYIENGVAYPTKVEQPFDFQLK
ncbi:energy transducer TonB [Acinetobacter pragensis]|uniref:TonB-dependent receptor n=1 Tax=Acinetobacter pragensis TaxID=1806892 RepID=A0A151Y4K5_9GAMM|nr:energy transducer TonB [Acinetobacter pragensis]KYQ72960.1 TonB-dependent receptor [Acinetobacter pragensis]